MTPTRDSDYYRPCVMLRPDGRQHRANVAHVRLDTVDSARAKLAAGKVAWVAPDDVQAITQEQGSR
jgi:hypothetical protein